MNVEIREFQPGDEEAFRTINEVEDVKPSPCARVTVFMERNL